MAPRKSWLLLVVFGYLAANVFGYALLERGMVPTAVLATVLMVTTGILWFIATPEDFVGRYPLTFRLLVALALVGINIAAYLFLPTNFLALMVLLSAFLLLFLFVPGVFLWP